MKSNRKAQHSDSNVQGTKMEDVEMEESKNAMDETSQLEQESEKEVTTIRVKSEGKAGETAKRKRSVKSLGDKLDDSNLQEEYDDEDENDNLRPRKRATRKSKSETLNKRSQKTEEKGVSTQPLEESDGDDNDDNPRKRASSRSKSAPNNKSPKQMDAATSDDEDKPTRRKGKRAPSTKISGRGPPEERTCPHCKKILATRDGLEYHIKNSVCRTEESTDSKLSASGEQKNSKKKERRRFRGSVADRTCPKCKKVFTSFLGRDYHVRHNVCSQTTNAKNSDLNRPLQPGSKFVTQFGVVEVVKDESIVDVRTPPSNLASQIKQYQKKKSVVDAWNSKVYNFSLLRIRARRSAINAMYASGNVRKQSIFQAYFGSDPSQATFETSRRDIPKQLPENPAAEDKVNDNRIVECILVPDNRLRIQAGETERQDSPVGGASQGKSPVRLFLQRHLLTEPYDENITNCSCAYCGRRFFSLPGMRYHANSKVCIQKQASEDEKRKERIEKIEKQAQLLLTGSGGTLYAASQQRPWHRKPNTVVQQKQRLRVKDKKVLGMYPEVLLSLGFKVVKEDMEFAEVKGLPPPIIEANVDTPLATTVGGSSEGELPIGAPERILEKLQQQLKEQQTEYQLSAADQKHGSMYKGVFNALGFKPVRRKRRKDNATTTRSSKRSRKTTKESPPPKPLPPIIDTRALADEVDSGRYPSITRYKDEAHSDTCILCRDGGELMCCDFCRNAEHMSCIRLKFTVKDPEPDDDFMCHKCIQLILARRLRAEKRRLEKKKRDEQRQQQLALEESRLNPGIKKGMEYPYMAAKGQFVSELVELLQDAQTRLKQSLASMKMNDVRRKVMGCYFNKKHK